MVIELRVVKIVIILWHSNSYLYNGMVAPMHGVTIKGAIWYQVNTRHENDDFHKSIISAIHCNLFYGHGSKESQLENSLFPLPRYIVVDRLANYRR